MRKREHCYLCSHVGPEEGIEHDPSCPFAALSTPADDDWLERHDAEVRAQERERCAADVEDMKLKAVLSINNRIFNLSCERAAAAIREANDE